MNARYLYMKILGLFLVLVGFSYSLTGFNHLFSYFFNSRIYTENFNIYVMMIGLFFPLYIFIFGIYFYFYVDYDIRKINKFLLVSFFAFLLLGIVMILVEILKIQNNFLEIFEFIHISFAPVIILLSFLGIYGCFKYKY